MPNCQKATSLMIKYFCKCLARCYQFAVEHLACSAKLNTTTNAGSDNSETLPKLGDNFQRFTGMKNHRTQMAGSCVKLADSSRLHTGANDNPLKASFASRFRAISALPPAHGSGCARSPPSLFTNSVLLLPRIVDHAMFRDRRPTLIILNIWVRNWWWC